MYKNESDLRHIAKLTGRPFDEVAYVYGVKEMESELITELRNQMCSTDQANGEKVMRLLKQVRQLENNSVNSVQVENIWLVYEGGEKDGHNDPNGKAVVLVKIDGQYRRVIEEGIDGPFSHCVHAGGIRTAPVDTSYLTDI